jgi:ABC-type transport system involved in multi-copper enzyme maturation permease subunit
MMLLYKAWLESRKRFALSFLAMAGLSVFFVVFHQAVRAAVTDHDVGYGEFIWKAVFQGQLRQIYVILALLLGLGGLDRERAYGTAGYTLALPVGRWRLVAARGVGGFMEAAVLAFLPAFLVPALSPFVHEPYPWGQALHYGALWTSGGVFIFAIGFLASVLFTGEYSAAIAAMTALFAYSIAADLPGMEHSIPEIHDTMNGSGPHGVKVLALIVLTATAMIGAAGYITTKRDY